MSPSSAGLYRVELNYGSDTDGGPGSVSGFLTIDPSEFDGSQNNTDDDTIFNSIPSWISEVSITVSGMTGFQAPANGTYTKSSFNGMAFTILDNSTDFVPAANFKNQMARFGFSTASGIFGLPNTLKPFEQEIASGEFPLTSTTPGPLPVLGILPLIYYYKKFKNNSFKL